MVVWSFFFKNIFFENKFVKLMATNWVIININFQKQKIKQPFGLQNHIRHVYKEIYRL